ncbi:HET-domain-containing protein [Leucogyrophana mollusca]|uniref:HET-domain-containing protein n=1 Tax=Leucogyrophana mollusca TaxID=85980 RepID=A0ACB8B473_9AGAM|nr:HET-domain-containing protein [Leucogyrophana mollusca]
MYLLNTSTLKLEQPRKFPEYAILSHVWGEEEVTFRDINGRYAARLEGYKKIKRCCAQARADGYKYAWIDTCCIDKSSSAELSEAINSMYRWYEDAAVCYAYLADVPSDENPVDERSKFRNSRYFKRGWTLQEVIASKIVEFFAEDWVKIATRESETFVIAEVTGVDWRVLSKRLSLANVSVAKKMSWASERKTTRVEDRAYSLMGLFGVHMPLLYGEGENAFIRLQHEIMRTSNDQSIFAWGITPTSYSRLSAPSSLLASSPSNFRHCAKVDRILPSDFLALFPSFLTEDIPIKSQFSVTNSGIQITLPIKSTRSGHTAALACVDTSDTSSCFVCLNLHRDRDGIYWRTQIDCVVETEPRDEYIIKDVMMALATSIPSRMSFKPRPLVPLQMNLDFRSAIQEGFVLCSLPPERHHSLKLGDGSFVREAFNGLNGSEHILAFRDGTGRGFVVTIGEWWTRVCIHVTVVTFSSSPSNVDTNYDPPDHTLVDGFGGCESASHWASSLLPLGKRVTVTYLETGLKVFNVTIAVHPDAHRYVRKTSQSQSSQSRSQWLRTIQFSKVGLLEG